MSHFVSLSEQKTCPGRRCWQWRLRREAGGETRGEIWSLGTAMREKNRFGAPTTSVEKGKATRGERKKREDFIFFLLFDFYCRNILLSRFFLTMSCRRARLCIRVKGSPLVGWSVVLSSKMLVLVLSLVLYVFWFTFEGCRVEQNIIKTDLVGSLSLSTGSLCLSVSLRVCPSVCGCVGVCASADIN